MKLLDLDVSRVTLDSLTVSGLGVLKIGKIFNLYQNLNIKLYSIISWLF